MMVQRYEGMTRYVHYEDYADLEKRCEELLQKVQELDRQLLEIRKATDITKYTGEEAQQLALTIEEIIDPIYCQKCGACGEEGCCSPDMCEELPCLYGEGYLKTYHELEAENAQLREEIKGMEFLADKALILVGMEENSERTNP